MPLDKLLEAHRAGVKTRHELAEFSEVTELFLADVLHHYKEKHGVYCHVGEYWIFFDPLGILEIRQQVVGPADFDVR